ncbi:MAG TPA: pectinesterase family protein [Vicinamibacterales bacterium]|nr:pectinesterase family protein [Vicinamibacterales bacterium]
MKVRPGLAVAASLFWFTGAAHAGQLMSPLEAAPGVVTLAGGQQVFRSLQAAVDALPDTGGEITLAPGVYREKVLVTKANVRLRGLGRKPDDVVITWSDGAVQVGGTFKTASLEIRGDDFHAENLTVANDYWLRNQEPSQAVALYVTGDRAVFYRVRFLGHQDTLYAADRKCDGTQPDGSPCRVSRQYFRDCYIEGHVDFIFGNSKAYFENCHIHGVAHDEVMLTAHMRTAADQDRGYVFHRCRITADEGVGRLWLGRPWRDYSRVVFIETRIDAKLERAGWREWTPGTTERLATAFYAERGSTGIGSRDGPREPFALSLSGAEAEQWSARNHLSGHDGWAPEDQFEGPKRH